MNFYHCCGMRLVVDKADVEPEPIDDRSISPFKQGHRDVGASQDKAFCHDCNKTITAETTQEAFNRWNATHNVVPG